MTPDHAADTKNASSYDSSLYRIGGAAAFITALLILAVAIIFTIYPQPESVQEWFDLFQSSKLIALLDFWSLELLMYLMLALVFLALYFALKDHGLGLMAISLTFALLGVAIFLATNNPISMLSLSSQYAQAATESEKTLFLAAGQAVLTNTGQRVVGGFNLGLFLVSVAGLLTSAVMIRSTAFGRTTAYVGIAAFALSLLDYLRQIFTQSAVIT